MRITRPTGFWGTSPGLSPGELPQNHDRSAGAGAEGTEAVRRDAAEATGVVVVDRLLQLGAGVHDERAVLLHGLVDGLAAEEEQLERLVVARRQREPVAGPEHDEVAAGDRGALGAGGAAT